MIFWSSGLWWPFLPLLALDDFFEQRPASGEKNNQNWVACNNQMSKPISESKSPIYSTVIGSNCKRAIEGKHVKSSFRSSHSDWKKVL